MNYNEAKENLRIAEEAFKAEAYSESSDIVYKVANFAAFDTEMDRQHHKELINELFKHIDRLNFCDNEGYWEIFSELSSLLSEKYNNL